MTILQVSRWDELLKDRLAVAKKLGLDDKFSKELYQQIHLMSIRIQTKVMNAEKTSKRTSNDECRTFEIEFRIANYELRID